MKLEVCISKIVPGIIFFALWLDGWFFPLILLPIFYVVLVEKKSLGWLGFSRYNLGISMILSMLIILVLSGIYYPIFLHYLPYLKKEVIGVYAIFLDVAWYPVYEEVAYRSFALVHSAEIDKPYSSTRNVIVNLLQSLLFLFIHKHHFNTPLILVPVFLLGFLNGFLFLRTRNIYGCIVSHSVLNGFALFLRYLS